MDMSDSKRAVFLAVTLLIGLISISVIITTLVMTSNSDPDLDEDADRSNGTSSNQCSLFNKRYVIIN